MSPWRDAHDVHPSSMSRRNKKNLTITRALGSRRVRSGFPHWFPGAAEKRGGQPNLVEASKAGIWLWPRALLVKSRLSWVRGSRGRAAGPSTQSPSPLGPESASHAQRGEATVIVHHGSHHRHRHDRVSPWPLGVLGSSGAPGGGRPPLNRLLWSSGLDTFRLPPKSLR